jgi:hypothetical protein
MELSILTGRAAAAEAAIERTRHQVNVALGERVAVGRSSRIVTSLKEIDALSAERAAHGTVNRFLAAELDAARAFKLATEVERAAAWEATDAFTRARNEYLERLPDKTLDRLFKVFQTAGDKNVCDVCDPLDGAIVPARETFPRGEPPIHGSCRCSFSLYTEDELP